MARALSQPLVIEIPFFLPKMSAMVSIFISQSVVKYWQVLADLDGNFKTVTNIWLIRGGGTAPSEAIFLELGPPPLNIGSKIAPEIDFGINNHNLKYLEKKLDQFSKKSIFRFLLYKFSIFPLVAEIAPKCGLSRNPHPNYPFMGTFWQNRVFWNVWGSISKTSKPNSNFFCSKCALRSQFLKPEARIPIFLPYRKIFWNQGQILGLFLGGKKAPKSGFLRMSEALSPRPVDQISIFFAENVR